MLKQLTSCIGEYKRSSILAPVFVTLEVILEVFIPYLMSLIIDYGITGGNMGAIARIGVALVIATLFSLLFGACSGWHAAGASAGFAKNVRARLFHRIQAFSFGNIDRFSTPSLVTRLTTDVTNLQNSYQMIIRILVRAPVLLIFSMIMAFSINAELSLIFLCAVPILGVGLYFIIRNAHPVFERVFRTYDKLNNVVQENLRGIRVVKSFVRSGHETEKFGKISESIYKDFSLAEKIVAFNAPLMQFAMYGCLLLISWFGAKLIVSDSMTTGQLMSLFTYATQILMSLMMISMVLVMITISRASAERVVEVLEEESSLQSPQNPVCEIHSGAVAFRHVDFSYTGKKEKLALRDVSLSVRSGEVIGIVGGTGSAKTTLVQLIARLYDVTAGEVLVDGVDVRNYDLDTLRSAVAMVLQKNVLFSGTIRDNLRWGDADASDDELVEACKLAQADGFIRTLPDGYDTYIEQGGTNVSGGQKQRLCIARALLKKPKILILDDSTSAVDTKTDALILKAFRENLPDTTKIIIAQRISSVEAADQIVVMEGGTVDAVGTHQELLESNRIYQEIAYSQTKGDSSHATD